MRKIATLVGCAIGDALGRPFEMRSSDYGPLKEWDGSFKDGSTFGKGKSDFKGRFDGPGRYTDDTMATICLAKSLIRCKGFDPRDVAQEYLGWYKSGEFRGMGGTTCHALSRLKLGVSWKESGLVGDEFGGNGTAMRVSPIGLVYRNNLKSLVEYSYTDAMITHNNNEPKVGSLAVALGTAFLSQVGMAKTIWIPSLEEEVIESTPRNTIDFVIGVLPPSHTKALLKKAKKHLEAGTDYLEATRDIGVKAKLKGWVPETVAAAFYCLAKTDNFKDAVVMAVKIGGDGDTTSAITGALAGTYYGLDAIPQEYKDGVEDFELLNTLTEQLLAVKVEE